MLALPVASFCLIGQCAPLHRTDWVAMMLCGVGLLMVLPKQDRMRVALKGTMALIVVAIVTVLAVHVVSTVTNKDFSDTMWTRIKTLLPGMETGRAGHAWDTRIGSTMQEVQIWMENPLMGGGLGVQMGRVFSGRMENTGAYFHNSVTASLATTGIFGGAGFICLILSMVAIGRRMIRDQVDRGSVLMGAVAYFAALYMCICSLTGMLFTGRSGMYFGLICGMVFRARDMQAATVAMMQSNGQHDTGMLPLDQYDPLPMQPAFDGQGYMQDDFAATGAMSRGARRHGSEDEWA
jgi:hypothetical protein